MLFVCIYLKVFHGGNQLDLVKDMDSGTFQSFSRPLPSNSSQRKTIRYFLIILSHFMMFCHCLVLFERKFFCIILCSKNLSCYVVKKFQKIILSKTTRQWQSTLKCERIIQKSLIVFLWELFEGRGLEKLWNVPESMPFTGSSWFPPWKTLR